LSGLRMNVVNGDITSWTRRLKKRESINTNICDDSLNDPEIQ
jgi:hypothetical protein